MYLEDIGAVTEPQRDGCVFIFGRCQPGDRDGHVCSEHQDTALRVKEFIHVLFIDIVKSGFIGLVKLYGRGNDFFIAPAIQPGFNVVSQLGPDPAFCRDQIAHAFGNRELFHHLSSSNKKDFHPKDESLIVVPPFFTGSSRNRPL